MGGVTDVAPAAPTRVIFLGPPGAGKGTQAARLAVEWQFARISTGDMLRDAIAKGTPLGREAAPIMERGELVPDGLLLGLIRDRIRQADCASGYVLDGFPRTLPQAEGLEAMVGNADFFVFDVEVPREELMRRLSGRRWCPTCQSTYHVDTSPPTRKWLCDWDSTPLVQREDDKETVVARRLAEYDERTRPLIQYYQGRSHFKFHRIDGNRAPDAVFGELKSILEAGR